MLVILVYCVYTVCGVCIYLYVCAYTCVDVYVFVCVRVCIYFYVCTYGDHRTTLGVVSHVESTVFFSFGTESLIDLELPPG